MKQLTVTQKRCIDRKDIVLLSTKAFEGKQGLVTVKTSCGWRLLDTRYGLYMCSKCYDLLDQQRVPDDDFCPCCRLGINLEKACEQIKELGL